MDFLELARGRYSSRAYKPDPVEKDKLNTVLEAALLAPTASNRQPFRLIIIDPAGKESELRRIYDREWFARAPVIICACAVPEEAWVRADGRAYRDIDLALVMDHLMLAAAGLGLGTCWVANFNAAAAREVLGLPDTAEPVAFTPLGYPADQPKPKKRKTQADLVRYERW